MIKRTYQEILINELFQEKIVLLIGARQVGKTTLLTQIQNELNVASNWLNADEPDVLNAFESAQSSDALIQLVGTKNRLVVIDEAQRIPNIGLKLKLIYDKRPDIQLLITGSSSFDLQNEFSESLTGRKRVHHLYPISFQEYADHTSTLEAKRLLERRLIYGFYPEVVNNPGDEEAILLENINSYLYKDVLRLDGIRKSSQLMKLVQAVALQVGSEVSYNELATLVGNIDSTTVERYLDLLEKAFILYKLPGLNRNFRNELKKAKKYYFYDNGIRNAVINNFSPINLRTDRGALWENFLLAERIKSNEYQQRNVHSYFWRTRDQAEIDYLEDIDGTLHAFEFKWTPKKVRFPKSFIQSYPNHTTKGIDKENYLDFILGEPLG